MWRGFESHPSSSFFFSEKKELLGLVVLPCFIFIGLRVFMYVGSLQALSSIALPCLEALRSVHTASLIVDRMCINVHILSEFHLGVGELLPPPRLLKSYYIVRYVTKNCSKTVRSVCVARRQRFPKNGPFRFFPRYVPFRSTFRSVPFRCTVGSVSYFC